MKCKYLLLASLVASFMMWGCGDDDSSGISDIDREDVSSSSVKSSSSVSSSSEEKEDLPDGIRSAKLEDLPKNLKLNIDGHEVHMAMGVKQGLFSFWVLDTGKIAVISDFKKGVVKINDDNTSTSIINTLDEKYFLYKLVKKGTKITFTMKDGELQYAVNDGEAKAAKTEQVSKGNAILSNEEDLVGKEITCKAGDTTNTYKFFLGRFVLETKIGKKSSEFIGGYADIHRSTLFMIPMFFSTSVPSIMLDQVSSKFSLGEGECSNKDFKAKNIEASEIALEWSSYDKENNFDWTLKLEEDKTFDLRANGGEDEYKTGKWDVYGNVLLMKNEACLDPNACAKAVMGSLEDYEKGQGFTFNHNSSEKPALPKEWVIQQYE